MHGHAFSFTQLLLEPCSELGPGFFQSQYTALTWSRVERVVSLIGVVCVRVCVCACVCALVAAAVAAAAAQPTSAQKFHALGAKPKQPRDRPFISTTQTSSSRAAVVGQDSAGGGSMSPTQLAGDSSLGFGSMDDSLMDGMGSLLSGQPTAAGSTRGAGSAASDSVVFPHIPGAEPPKGRGSKAGGRKGEWGETALRKQAGSLQVTQRGAELLKLGSAGSI